VNAGATVAASSRYYPSLPTTFVNGYVGSAGGSVHLFNTPDVTVHQNVSYRPYTFGRVLPVVAEEGIGLAEEPDLDLVSTERQYLVYSGGVGMSHGLSRRSSMNLQYNYLRRSSLGNDRWLFNQSASAGYRLSLTQGLAFRTSYGYGVGRYEPNNRSVESHNIDVGFDYGRALSFSRRTTLSFGTGTAATGVSRSRTDLETSVTRDGSRMRLHAAGHARLAHEIGRTWQASLAYQRGVRFVDEIDEPVVGGHSAVAALGGLFNRRLTFQSTVRAFIRGEGVSSGRRFDMYLGSASLSLALSRYAGLGVVYAYYRYRFDNDLALPIELPRSLERQSIRAQLSVWAPLFQRVRRTNATR
jgi:hypothetical protein